MDFGVSFNNFNSLRQGTREGAREAVVAEWSGDCTGTTNQNLQCLVEDQVGLGADTAVRVEIPSTYTVGEKVTVCTQASIESITGFFTAMLDGRTVTTSLTMRIEAIDTDDPLTAFSEGAPTGGDWSWC